MSRSVYDPPPSYATCGHCGNQYDNSGYYGTDDESHFCRKKAKILVRMIMERLGGIDELVREIRDEFQAERAAAESKQAQEKRRRLEAMLDEHRSAITTIEAELAGPA